MKYKIYNILFIFLLFPFHAFAERYSPESLKNPNIADRTQYVADPASLVSHGAISSANAALWNLRQKTGVEVAIVVVPNTGDFTAEDFATKLFDDWKIGKRDKDNGVLVLIIPDQREARIATGYGVEGVITDISALRIIERSIKPYMKENNLDGAVMAVSQDISNILSDPLAAEELKSNQGEKWEEMPESDVSSEDLLIFIICICLAMFLISVCMYVYDVNRFKRRDRYDQARGWQDQKSLYLALAFLSLGLGIFPYWLAKRRYNKTRNGAMTCPACKGKMYKLNEEEDNNLLSPSQDFEEKLDSVDYDVWVCEDCGTVERYAFPNKNTKYQECPNCHTVAMTMVQDHVVIPPTTRREGLGERIYECKYCHNNPRTRYKIPRKQDNSAAAAIAAGAILGAGRGNSGIGGGFGGGRTGGGGATGHW